MRAWALLGLLVCVSCASAGTSEVSSHPQRLFVPAADVSQQTPPPTPEIIGGKGKALDPTMRVVVAAPPPAPALARIAPPPRVRPPSH